MGIFSSWDYTTTVTFWRPTLDEFGQPSSYTRSSFGCSFVNGGDLVMDDAGEEFVPRTSVFLEATDVNVPEIGDRMSLGASTAAEPPVGAEIVRTVRSFNNDTFREGTPDRVVITG